MIIFIDELDRCRPDYALKFLERLKHYFDVPNILFVLMINKNHLLGIIRHTYGDEIDGLNYIEKYLCYHIIDLPIISKKLPRRNLGSMDDYKDTYEHYKHLFEEEHTLLLNIESLTEGQKERYVKYLRYLVTFSNAMDLSYREHHKLCVTTAIYYDKIFSSDESVIALYAYFITLLYKHPNILKEIKAGGEHGHKKAIELLEKIKSRFFVGYEGVRKISGQSFVPPKFAKEMQYAQNALEFCQNCHYIISSKNPETDKQFTDKAHKILSYCSSSNVQTSKLCFIEERRVCDYQLFQRQVGSMLYNIIEGMF